MSRPATRYRIEHEIGAGGMATVFVALDERLDRRVALKVLRAELATLVGAERFLAEIRTARTSSAEGHGLAWLGGLTLDLKRGGRMMVKYPGLTIVGGVAMAFATWVSAVGFKMVMLFLSPELGMVGSEEIRRGIGLYPAVHAGQLVPAVMVIHTRGDPMAIGPRALAIAGTVDPTLRLSEFQRMD